MISIGHNILSKLLMNFRICHQSSIFKIQKHSVIDNRVESQPVTASYVVMSWSLQISLFVLVGLKLEVSTSFLPFPFVVRPGVVMAKKSMTSSSDDTANTITILGFGSLLSERSSRTTFPDLFNFRLGRVRNYRRVFGHPASIFFQRGEFVKAAATLLLPNTTTVDNLS